MRTQRLYIWIPLVAAAAMGAAIWSPSPDQALADDNDDDGLSVELAKDTTDSLVQALLAAVLDVTDRTTPENAAPNSLAISMLVPECQDGYRLLDGTGDPLDRDNRPKSRFERRALAKAMDGETTQVVRNGRLRTVAPLPFADAKCAVCHANYLEYDPGAIVGAVSISVPLLGEDDDD